MSGLAEEFNNVVKSRQANDHLSLRMSSSVRKILKKYQKGGPEEKVQFSDFIVKINPKGKPQERVLLVTDKGMYNLIPTDYGKCKRRIALALVSHITVATKSDEFVVHVPSEYDYRLMSLRKREIVECLQRNYQALTGNDLRITMSNQVVLKSVCMTKAQAKKQRKLRKAEGLASAASKTNGEAGAGASALAAAASTLSSGGGAGATSSAAGAGAEGKQRGRSATTTWSGKQSNVTPEDFELIKVIGRGSFGKVMLVRKHGSPKTYAMKILRKQAIIERNQVEHTRAEREILEQVDHPFLMKLHFAFQTPTKLYLVMDMITGGELFFHLKNERRFKQPRARLYTAEILLGLAHLHSLDVIYRDLKPENILLDSEGHVKLTDFGLSKKFTAPGEKAMTFCGTPEYLAPEVVMGVGHDKAVDWWSLGILLFEMLVGLPPFYSENTNLMYELIQKADLRIPGFVSYDARDLLKKLLKQDPRDRLGSGDDDADPIKAHTFFESIDWQLLYERKVQPDFVPQVRGDTDTQFFDREFTSERVVDSVVPQNLLAQTTQTDDFGGFTYKGNKGPLS